ncbi:MAG TPA: hypothetical protein VIU13_09395 [Chryseolinea sp.]
MAPAKGGVEDASMDGSGLYNYSLAFLCIYSNSDANRELDKGKNEELLNMLIVTDWIRVIPTFILVTVVFTMVKKSIAS